MNFISLIGTIVNDLELKEENGKKFLLVNIAVLRAYKNDEGIYETDIIPCILQDSIADKTVEYCKQGDIIGIKGRIETVNSILRVNGEKVSFLKSESWNKNE